MKKAHIWFSTFIILQLNVACSQMTFDEKVNSLYRNTVPLITVEEYKKRKSENDKILILDTRSENEFAVSHIPGATFIDYDNFDEMDVASISKDSEVVLYCSIGYRSERIGEKMIDMGFKNVKNLYGGIFHWKNTDNEVIDTKGDTTDHVHTYNRLWSKWLYKGIKIYE